MSTETLKDKVIFGRSVTEETMVVSYSTSCKIMEQSTIKITKRSLTGIQNWTYLIRKRKILAVN